jgi:ribosomal protein S6--L-glutamate ligase
MNLGFLVEERYLSQDQPSGLIEEIRKRGHNVTIIHPEKGAFDVTDERWLRDVEILVARGRSWALLSMLSWAELRGVRTINRRSAISAVHNKVDMGIAMAGDKLPVPHTYLGPVEHLAREVPTSDYPLILKPIFGDNCRGLKLVHKPDELEELQWSEPVALAQEYLPNNGCDLKLYGIGDKIWAVRKPSPFQPNGKGSECRVEAITATDAMADLGRRCANLFGLELFGVDCVLGPKGPVVIEVNDFPNYTAVPNAGGLLADYIFEGVPEA